MTATFKQCLVFVSLTFALAVGILAATAAGMPCWINTNELACSKVVPDPASCFVKFINPPCPSTVPAGTNYGDTLTTPGSVVCVYAPGTLLADGTCRPGDRVSKTVNCRIAGGGTVCGGPLAEIDPDDYQ